ncbi:phosphoglycerate kinase [bacterium (Candidatus Blackallbacteria) CG17_big_fil_post_rev_8_21_14_2_50_48_46]|uniref:Phosphoglycerate kinase n=1 Tax=bacterium (Candidatus Blackallbacteria) CG17_big_fil_post_rev_8_21_14_2_50_48_46 TaxID=2014261 RepID=A0A2M7FZS2_9BACT|nr:MAG: phosphoglycerate kinase [bacterium (Candidatus Blackallbacteria) CG18_big_fil_WC_8_21_14_2_50_49_26]PIW14908.1 MAG: phosphoglycerate kinase [bacterium (Candidatus Blackallbacteria) CG17_big_fil_post_rev_8_21_14_2_50_48_46]PIW44304.1 MAG: phosphoglycerate kinase [bacterium (Candidatus Blackallbacteria) CG13_big_fil_rev_8_21_14_2_50_49_14]
MPEFVSLKNLDPDFFRGKRALVRVDFNVPIKEGKVSNDQRIRAALPTLRYLLNAGSRVILMSHLGRPKGKPQDAFRLKPVGDYLAKLLELEVLCLDDCIGTAVEEAVSGSQAPVVLLENTRFYAQETDNDPEFAAQLAKLGDFYVNDAFGTAHRAHASTEGVAAYLPAYAGFLMEKELNALGGMLESAQSPFVAIIGGAKVSSKLAVLENLLPKVDALVIGGAMAYTFLAAQGLSVGKSLTEPELFETALALLNQAKALNKQIVLPVDTVLATGVDAIEATLVVDLHAPGEDISELSGVDIGPDSVAAIEAVLEPAKTVLWNGPMGVFENPPFAAGTEAIAKIVARITQKGAVSVVGGGDSVAAVEKLGLADQFTHVSTGGGASLEFLEGKTLPGVAVLETLKG